MLATLVHDDTPRATNLAQHEPSRSETAAAGPSTSQPALAATEPVPQSRFLASTQLRSYQQRPSRTHWRYFSHYRKSLRGMDDYAPQDRRQSTQPSRR